MASPLQQQQQLSTSTLSLPAQPSRSGSGSGSGGGRPAHFGSDGALSSEGEGSAGRVLRREARAAGVAHFHRLCDQCLVPAAHQALFAALQQFAQTR